MAANAEYELDGDVVAKRHHFVPQGFLRGFAAVDASSRSMVWVYDKRPDHQPRYRSVKSIAWKTAYYAQETEEGTEDLDAFEANLAQSVDNEVPRILRRITPVPGKTAELTDAERGQLGLFVGLSLTRVPSFRDGIDKLHTQIARHMLSLEGARNPALDAVIREYKIEAQAKEWGSIRPMIELALAIGESALSKRFQFFVAPESVPFVTSDNPVVFSGGAAGIKGVGPAHPAAEILMNLRSDLALVCTPMCGHRDMHVFALRPPDARKFNRGIVRAARLHVFANHRSDQLDALVKKYVGQEQRIIV